MDRVRIFFWKCTNTLNYWSWISFVFAERGIILKTERANNRKTVSRQQQTTEITNTPLMPVIPRYLIFLFQVVLAFCFISFSGLHQSSSSSSSSFNFVQGKTKLNIKSSGIDMVHASHILCASNRTLCEDIMELLEPFAEDDLLRPKLERGFEELARKFSRCPTGKRNGGDLGYFPRGEMTKDFDGTSSFFAALRVNASLTFTHILSFITFNIFILSTKQPSSSRNWRRRCTNRLDRTKRPTGST
jgi:hypothetical protein